MKKLLLLVLLPVLACALVTPTGNSDITGNSATHAVASSGQARWVQFIAPSTNTSTVRIGGSNTSSTVGVPMAPGSSLFYPPIPVDLGQPVPSNNYYDLSSIYYYAVTNDKINISWGF
jgi:hypothetical protein